MWLNVVVHLLTFHQGVSLMQAAVAKASQGFSQRIKGSEVTDILTSLTQEVEEMESVEAVTLLKEFRRTLEISKELKEGRIPVTEGSVVMKVTPEIAKLFLSKNIQNNRKLDRRRKDAMILVMKRGDFESNGQGILFDEEGNMIDGQHRFNAIIASGVSVEIRLVFGLKKKVFDTIDQHKTRSVKDMLVTAVIGATPGLPGAAELLHHWDNGDIRDIFNTRKKAQKRDHLKIIEKYPDIVTSTKWVNSLKSLKALMYPDTRGFYHFLFSRINATSTEEFFTMMDSGEELYVGHPIHTYRKRIYDNLRANVKGRVLTKKEELVYVIRTWNAYIEGREVKTLRMTEDGAIPKIKTGEK